MEDEKRQRALRYLNITGVGQCIVGLLLLILAAVARVKHGTYVDGIPPYYTGAFIGMSMVLIQAVLGLVVFIRGKDCVNKLEAAEKVGCIMQTYCFMAIATNVGYLIAVLMVSFTGVCLNSDCSYTETRDNRRLAISIIVFICVGVITSAIGLAIVCKFSSSFGLKMLSRGQYQISNMVDNTDDVIAYIAAEQTAGTNENEAHHSNHLYHHHSHPDPRLAFPEQDFSTHHLQHYLTQQYRDRIRKRRKKNRKRNKQSNVDSENRRRRQEREAPYVLPPVTVQNNPHREAHYELPPVTAQTLRHRSRSPTQTPPPPPPSPPPAPIHFPPPSPSPPLTTSPPQSRRTPPLTPSALPLPDIIPPRYQPPSQSSGTPSPPPPTPPLHHPAIIHVIPCGEVYQDEPPPYSP